jgi:transcriptional regulator of acetoin/glycerol metabolism
MFKGNRTLAAKHLGISRVTLWKRIKDYNITV